VLVHPPPAQVVGPLIEAKDLGRAGQTEGGSVNRQAPELTVLDPAVLLVGRAGLRGGVSPRRRRLALASALGWFPLRKRM
jgi:hypothetical protein